MAEIFDSKMTTYSEVSDATYWLGVCKFWFVSPSQKASHTCSVVGRGVPDHHKTGLHYTRPGLFTCHRFIRLVAGCKHLVHSSVCVCVCAFVRVGLPGIKLVVLLYAFISTQLALTVQCEGGED